jgi:hypothetical protein
MMSPWPSRLRSALGRELVVPALMLAAIALYVGDSLHLSLEALVLPAALIAVIVVALLWRLLSAFWGVRTVAAPAPEADGDDETAGPILDWRPWLMVAFPALLVALMDTLGALAALVALVLGAQLILDRRSPLRALVIAVAVSVPTIILFKHVLYVRFPGGLLGLG